MADKPNLNKASLLSFTIDKKNIDPTPQVRYNKAVRRLRYNLL